MRSIALIAARRSRGTVIPNRTAATAVPSAAPMKVRAKVRSVNFAN